MLNQNDKLRETFGHKLRRARIRNKLTQAEVAKRADINPNYYARIERGEINPSMEKLHEIISALGIKSSEILPF